MLCACVGISVAIILAGNSAEPHNRRNEEKEQSKMWEWKYI